MKIANGETDNKGNNKQNEVQSTEILEIPKDENGNILDPKNLGDDQKQVFYQVMKKVKEWIEYKENDTKMKESMGNEYKLEKISAIELDSVWWWRKCKKRTGEDNH